MKKHIGELAILGGTPCFEKPLGVGRPHLRGRDRFLSIVNGIMDSGRLTNDGPIVREFERRISEYLEVENCVAVSNATMGIQITMKALGVAGEVILPSFTFAASAQALSWLNVKPVFCDMSQETHNIDPRRVTSLISSRTSAILGVHLWGRPSAIPELLEIADRHRLRLVFDASHAVGSAFGGRMLGGFGDAEIFSFHATKILTTFEGGMICTRDAVLAGKLRAMRNFGFADSGTASMPGTNGKMAEVNAAMGLASLDELDDAIALHKGNHQRYRWGLCSVPGIKLVEYGGMEKSNYRYLVVEVSEREFGCSTSRLQSFLEAENIWAKRYFHPGCHRMPAFSDPLRGQPVLGITEDLGSRILALPNDSGLTHADIDRICGVIRLISLHARSLDPDSREILAAECPT